jgi:hypothetical protein
MYYIGHPIFQELAPAVHMAVDKFYKEHKDFKGPASSFMIGQLAKRARDVRPSPAKTPPKRGKSPSLSPTLAFYKALSLAHVAAPVPPAALRPEKTKKQKSSVCNFS